MMGDDWSCLVTLLKAKRVAKVLNWIFWRDFVRSLAGANLWTSSNGGYDPNSAGLRSVTTAILKKTRGCQAALQHDLPPQGEIEYDRMI